MSNKKSDFWYYTRRERKATVALLLTAILLFLLPAIYRYQPRELSATDTRAFQKAAAQLDSLQSKQKEPPKVASAFHFDPNTADRDVLTALGLPASTAQTIINYRNKVGLFRVPEDLEKIYNLSKEDYLRLAPFINIQGNRSHSSKHDMLNSKTKPILFSFDPNTVTLEELIRLGLSRGVATTLIRYRAKGGHFRRKEDLQKIYGLTLETYQQLEAFINLPETASDSIQTNEHLAAVTSEGGRAIPTSYAGKSLHPIDINQATVDDWRQLPGIGPVLSGRIVKFRDKLGGFADIEQVARTYGLSDSTFQLIRPYLEFSPINRKININIAAAEVLQAHPYINWQQARVLVAYRREHGPFQSLDDLRKVRALKETFIQDIAPYLEFGTP